MKNKRLLRAAAALTAAVVLSTCWSIAASADEGPQPPCGETTGIVYPKTEEPPLTHVWTPSDLPPGWTPPACTGLSPAKFQLLVSLAAHFHYERDIATLLSGFGAISRLTEVRYWSVTDKRLQALFESAVALEGSDAKHPRGDFTSAEMAAGPNLYFLQKDNRSTNRVVYRLHVREVGADGFSVEMENMGGVKYYLLNAYQPHALQSVFYLKQTAPFEWDYYCLVRIGPGLSLFASSPESYINRALALFYHYTAAPKG